MTQEPISPRPQHADGVQARHALFDTACSFWFEDNEKARSPFPKEIQSQLRCKAEEEYIEWLRNMTAKDREEVDDDELVSIFEWFLFGEALKVIDPEDIELALTINHPFMPRVGDVVNDDTHGESRVERREIKQKEDKKPYMVVVLKTTQSDEQWQTEFLLPP